MTLKGVDLSHNNWLVNEREALLAPDFVWMKATQGLTEVDGAYPRWAPILKAAGHWFGAYLFLDPNEGNPDAQVNHFLDAIGESAPRGYALDCEMGNPNDAFCHDAAVKLHERTGKPVVIYCNRYWADNLPRTLDLSYTVLWLATLGDAPEAYRGKRVAFNQGSWTGKPAGGGSAVDLDTYAGSIVDLLTEVSGAPITAPKPEPAPKPLPEPQPVPVHAPVENRPTFSAAALTHLFEGDHNPHDSIRVLQHALNGEGCGPIEVTGRVDTHTRAAYRHWQERCGYTGTGANGIPGIYSLTRLASKSGRFELTA
jgi:GH25 family lysozyme M1 (1,4-beta-N-acetylmuramidase)